MHIRDIFFPPRTDAGWGALFRRISDFEALAPSFVSVTYGAGGSTREQTHDLVVRLKEKTRLDPVPHLTCVCHIHSEIEQILERYAKRGISNLMALHGDPPQTVLDDFQSLDRFGEAEDDPLVAHLVDKLVDDLVVEEFEWSAAAGHVQRP